MAPTSFESIDSSHEYLRLLVQQVSQVIAGIEDDIATAKIARAQRRVDALRLVDFKLHLLNTHLTASRGVLNDLRMLRRLLVGDRARVDRRPSRG